MENLVPRQKVIEVKVGRRRGAQRRLLQMVNSWQLQSFCGIKLTAHQLQNPCNQNIAGK